MEREYKVSHSVVGISIGSPQKMTMESVSQIALPPGPYQTFDYTSRNGQSGERSFSLPKI